MSNYSEEDKQEFRMKDLRINRTAVIKSMLESGKVGVDEVEKNCIIAEKYVKYIYNGVDAVTEKTENIIDWSAMAETLKLPKPNANNIKLLDELIIGLKDITADKVDPSSLLVYLWSRYKSYPTTKTGVKTVLHDYCSV